MQIYDSREIYLLHIQVQTNISGRSGTNLERFIAADLRSEIRRQKFRPHVLWQVAFLSSRDRDVIAKTY